MKNKMINMPFLKIVTLCLLFLAGLSLVSCYSGTVADDPEIHREIANQWLQRSYSDPGDTDALKNLGIFYVQTNEHNKAKVYLRQCA
jgi:uncharacterized protein HemY